MVTNSNNVHNTINTVASLIQMQQFLLSMNFIVLSGSSDFTCSRTSVSSYQLSRRYSKWINLIKQVWIWKMV